MRYPIIYGVSILILLLKCSKGEEAETKTSVCREREKCIALLGLADDFITSTKTLSCNLDDATDLSECNRKEKTSTYMDFTSTILKEIKANVPSCQAVECSDRPRNCFEVMASGDTKSGTYMIFPMSKYTASKLVNVYCDMDTDGGGWTVIQRRGNFTPKQEFQQNWQTYKNGFGNIEKDFYLGNDNIYALTNQNPVQLRIELMDVKGVRRYATYKKFRIDDENRRYTLHVSGYKGNAGDGMEEHNGKEFSTIDKGNTAVVEELKGPWWIGNWAHAHLNGLYDPGVEIKENMHWFKWNENNEGLAFAEMKIR